MTIRTRAIVAALLASLAACDRLWSLQKVPPAEPDSVDAETGDAAIDMRVLDWDMDGVPNAIDNCPAVANPPFQADGDSDGVGDACDPHMMTAGDRIVEYAFPDDGLNMRWSPDGNGWTLSDTGMLSPTPDGTAHYLRHGAVDLSRPTLELGFKVVTIGANGAGASTAVRLKHATQSADCWMTEDSPDTQTRISFGYTTTGSYFFYGFQPQIEAGMHYTATLSRDVPQFHCSISGGSLDVTNGAPDPAVVTPEIAVEGMTIAIESLVIYAVQ